MGLRVWSGAEIFGKKIKTLWGGPIITKVKKNLSVTVPLMLNFSDMTAERTKTLDVMYGNDGADKQKKLKYFFIIKIIANNVKNFWGKKINPGMNLH